MTFDQLDDETLMTDPMTWPVNLQAEALAETARRIHTIGTVVLGCFDAAPQMKSALAADYRGLKAHLKSGTICTEGFRTGLISVHEALAHNGLLGSGWSAFDDLAYEIQIAIVFSEMVEAIFGADWSLDRFTPDNITVFLDGLDESPAATKH